MPPRRYIFNTLTVVSLVLMVATVGLWVALPQPPTMIYKNRKFLGEERRIAFVDHALGVNIEGNLVGKFVLPRFRFHTGHGRRDKPIPAAVLAEWRAFKPTVIHADKKLLGFRYHSSTADGVKATYILLPHYLFILLAAISPTVWLFKWNKRRKLGPNACPSCGYDLTGNVSGVCPECGKSIGTEAQA